MCNTLREYVLLSSISWPLQNILPHQPKLPKGIFHDYLTKRQLPEVGLLNPLLQLAAGIGFIRNVPPRLRNRQRFGSTNKNVARNSTFSRHFSYIPFLFLEKIYFLWTFKLSLFTIFHVFPLLFNLFWKQKCNGTSQNSVTAPMSC